MAGRTVSLDFAQQRTVADRMVVDLFDTLAILFAIAWFGVAVYLGRDAYRWWKGKCSEEIV